MADSRSTWSENVAATVRAELARRRIRAAALMDVLQLGRTATYDRVNGKIPFDTAELLLVASFLGLTAEELVREADRSSH
ncbi:helix-turn-helix domain-containing protein [Labedella endophytica]|nr:helix-turn-helix domain-containing protein [Labedella endophytica]